MVRTMAWSSPSFILLVLLVSPSSGEEVGDSTTSEELVKKAKVLADVSAVKAFIDSSEISVIGFFEDLGTAEAKDFSALVTEHPEWEYGVSTSAEVQKHFNVTGNTVSIFRQVDSAREDLVINETKDVNAAKLYRFLTINELRWVTEYNAMTAVGLLASKVQVHLLLLMEKGLEKQEEALKAFREAAEALRGKALFVAVDITVKGHERVMSFFHVRKSDLPAVAIYNTEDESKQVMGTGDITVQHLKDFYFSFLSGKSTEEDSKRREEKTEL
ncbi:hypothetical protein FKM82_004563 [Ascaphus truei]